MYQFIETIRIESGQIQNIAYHNARFNRTRSTFFGSSETIDLIDFIQPSPHELGVLKCRLIYSRDIDEISYAPYTIRPVHTLKLVEDKAIRYPYKSVNRENINQLFDQRSAADDVLITRDGRLTDTSIANVALYNGTSWVTPSTPLLEGTQRAKLLDQHAIIEKEILVEELSSYSAITLFNAMIEFQALTLPINALL